MSPGLIVALDDPDIIRAEELAESLSGRVAAFKVGLTLYAAHGPRALERVGRYAPVFCDLKLHDIPEQVARATAALAADGAWMLSVHASGGPGMVAAAVRAASKAPRPPLVAAVTVLTSLDASTLDLVGQGSDSAGQVTRLARLAVDSGAGALICSAWEAQGLRVALGPEIVLVCPGIRPAGSSWGDQARTATPAEAAAGGADFIVVGRPITEAPDPERACEQVLEELRSPA
ncbi:MAG: orotidine-5'-phosphate decarboxylase [Candidatus Methylomirabilales bacterium]